MFDCCKTLRLANLIGIVVSIYCGIPTQVFAEEPDGMAAVAALENVFVQAIEQAEPAVVSIARIRPPTHRTQFEERPNAPFSPEDLEDPDFVPNEFGAGIIVAVNDGKTFILTNYHVVKGGTVDGHEKLAEASLYVRLFSHRGYDARIYAADPRSDLAVLVIDEPNAKPIKFGDASKLKKGQLVLALGNPYAIARDGSASVSWGMISNISRRPDLPGSNSSDARIQARKKEETIHHLGNLLQVDTRLNLGTSGGALVNLRGELIGITTSLAALAGYESSVGYAVPVDEACLRIIKTLLEGKEVEYGFLGISLDQPQRMAMSHLMPKSHRPRGALVTGIISNSPAARSGLLVGDTILYVNDKQIYSRIDLTREIGKLAPEEQAVLKVQRDSRNELVPLAVDLGKWPVRDDEGIITSKRRYEPWRGLVVDYPSGRHKHTEQLLTATPQSVFPPAVLITESLPQSQAAMAELEPGDFISHVNNKPVATPGQFYEAVKGANGNVTLQLFRGRQVVVPAP